MDDYLNRHERQITLWQAQAQPMVRKLLQSACDHLHNYQERYLAQPQSAVAEEEQWVGNLLMQYTYLAERKTVMRLRYLCKPGKPCPCNEMLNSLRGSAVSIRWLASISLSAGSAGRSSAGGSLAAALQGSLCCA